ncbi:hypothetical protein ANN_20062 [Periplaneta americana]|uniref:Uncharacterized protein n=1 Tax=Periplaneta americana TaxID=6978 RepID=A0ABQ8SC65_PERAM|nr:hypothetical protein ANN_20062 [Periplaneta americana]
MVNGRRIRGRRRYQMKDDIKIYGSYAETKRKAENGKDWRMVMSVPSLLYGSETWVMKKKDASRLKTNEMKFLRSVAGYMKIEHKRNEEIRQELEIYELNNKIEEYRTTWMSHISRMQEDRMYEESRLKRFKEKTASLMTSKTHSCMKGRTDKVQQASPVHSITADNERCGLYSLGALSRPGDATDTYEKIIKQKKQRKNERKNEGNKETNKQTKEENKERKKETNKESDKERNKGRNKEREKERNNVRYKETKEEIKKEKKEETKKGIKKETKEEMKKERKKESDKEKKQRKKIKKERKKERDKEKQRKK